MKCSAAFFLTAAMAVIGEAAAATEERIAVAQATAQAAAEARVALPAARLYLLGDVTEGLAQHGVVVRVWRALASVALPAAALEAEVAAEQDDAALVVVAATEPGAARRAIEQVPRWPGTAAWLVAAPGTRERTAELAEAGAGTRSRVPPGRVLAVDVGPSSSGSRAYTLWRLAPRGPMRVRDVNLTAAALARLWRSTSFEGESFHVTTLDYSPMLIFNETVDPPIVDGFFGQLWAELQRRLNFKSEWLKPLDGGWGSRVNGTWNGMVSQLLNGTADAALNAFTITKARLDAVDFTAGGITTRVSAFVGLGRKRAVDWGDYAKPFASDLWTAAALAAAALVAGLVGMHALARRFGNPHAPAEPQCAGPLAAAFYVFGIFCQQGHDITPDTMSCRVVYITAYITAVTLLAAYSAGLIAFLTVFEVPLPFTTFGEMLAKKPLYRLGMAPSSGVFNTFEQAKDPVLRDVYRRLIAPGLDDLPDTHDEVRRRLCSQEGKPFAYMRSQILGLSTGADPCDVVVVPQVSFPETLAIMLPKRSPLRRLINWHLQEMKQQGIHQRILLTFWPKMVPLEENPFSIVGLENVLPIIVILSAGILISSILLFGEIIVCRIIKARKLDYTHKPSEEQTEDNQDIRRFSPSSATSTQECRSSGSKDLPTQYQKSMLPIREELIELPDDDEIDTRRLRHTVAASTTDNEY